MLMTAPFWIVATAAETYSRVATLMFWGLLTPAMEPELKPVLVEVKTPRLPEIERLPLAA